MTKPKEAAAPKIAHIERTPVTSSSNVKSVGFCPDTKRIHIEFNNGGVYAYDDCEQKHLDEMLAYDKTDGKSVGGYVHANLKPKKFTKLS